MRSMSSVGQLSGQGRNSVIPATLREANHFATSSQETHVRSGELLSAADPPATISHMVRPKLVEVKFHCDNQTHLHTSDFSDQIRCAELASGAVLWRGNFLSFSSRVTSSLPAGSLKARPTKSASYFDAYAPKSAIPTSYSSSCMLS